MTRKRDRPWLLSLFLAVSVAGLQRPAVPTPHAMADEKPVSSEPDGKKEGGAPSEILTIVGVPTADRRPHHGPDALASHRAHAPIFPRTFTSSPFENLVLTLSFLQRLQR